MDRNTNEGIDIFYSIQLVWKCRWFIAVGVFFGAALALGLYSMPQDKVYKLDVEIVFKPRIISDADLLLVHMNSQMKNRQVLEGIYDYITGKDAKFFDGITNHSGIDRARFATLNHEERRLEISQNSFDDKFILTVNLPTELKNRDPGPLLIEGMNAYIIGKNSRILSQFSIAVDDSESDVLTTNKLIEIKKTEILIQLYAIGFELYSEAVKANLPIKEYLEINKEPKSPGIDDVDRNLRLLSVLRQSGFITEVTKNEKIAQILALKENLLWFNSKRAQEVGVDRLFPQVEFVAQNNLDSKAPNNVRVETIDRNPKIPIVVFLSSLLGCFLFGIVFNFIRENQDRLKGIFRSNLSQ